MKGMTYKTVQFLIMQKGLVFDHYLKRDVLYVFKILRFKILYDTCKPLFGVFGCTLAFKNMLKSFIILKPCKVFRSVGPVVPQMMLFIMSCNSNSLALAHFL